MHAPRAQGVAGAAVALALLGVAQGRAWAATVEVSPGDDVESAVNALLPGDELVVRGGTYELSARFGVSIAGEAAAPIVIRAADGERPHFHRAVADQNIWDVDQAEYVTLRGLEFSGGSAGLRLSAVRHVTIEDCEIHDTGDVALRANDTGVSYEDLRILRNEIHHTNGTGEGMYLGCNSNGCRVTGSLIEGNYVHHTNQAGVEQGDGIELKEGSADNVIRGNVIHDTNYPCILTYSTVGNGGANVIEQNALWACGDHGIQSAADAVIRNNVVLGSAGDGIAMQPHQAGSPANLQVLHNTVLHASNDAISLRGAVGEVVIANNALYAQSGRALFVSGGDLQALVVAGNVGVGGVEGTSSGLAGGDPALDFVAAHYGGVPPIDLYPAAGSALIAAGDAAHRAMDDFDGHRRLEADVGAYAYSQGDSADWSIQPGFKPAYGAAGTGGTGAAGAPAELPDAGVPMGGAGPSGGVSPRGGGSGAAGAAATAGEAASTGSSRGNGCGCRMASDPTSHGLALAALGLALSLGAARRRRERR